MTSSLDGEKNLKPKVAIEGIQKGIISDSKFRIVGTMKYGPPNFDLYSFNGEISLDQKYGLGPK